MARWNKPEIPEPPGGWRPGEKRAAFEKAHQESIQQRDAAVRDIAGRMLQPPGPNKWNARIHAHPMAEQLGVSIWTVRKWAQQAAAMVVGGLDQGDLERMRSESAFILETFRDDAHEKGDIRTAVTAEEARTRVAGINPHAIQHTLRFDDDVTQTLVRLGPQVAIEAAFDHLAENADDYDGARVAGTRAAERTAVDAVVQRDTMKRREASALDPRARMVAEAALRVAVARGDDPEAFLAALAADLGFDLSVTAPPALPPGARFGLLVEATTLAMPDNDEDVAPWRPVLAELAGEGRDEDDAAE